MALLRNGDWIDARTGERVPTSLEADMERDRTPPTEHAVRSKSYVYVPAPTPGLEELPQGVMNLIIATAVELSPMRFQRKRKSFDEGYEHWHTHDDLKTALSHPP